MFYSPSAQSYYIEMGNIKQIDRLISELKEAKEKEIVNRQRIFDEKHQLSIEFDV